MDTLKIQERIEKTIELGESQFREFKSAFEGPPNAKVPREPKVVSKDIAEAMVAFANADGGELLVGVEDDGSVTGYAYKEDALANLLKAPTTGVHQDTPLQSYVSRKVKLDSKEVLYFAVEKSTRILHQTSDGRCLQRRDTQNIPVSAAQLQFERQEQISREYDRHFVDGADVMHLDTRVLKSVSDHITKGMSPEKCLQYLGLAEYGLGSFRLRRAALLLFATDIARWHPRCEVKLVRIKGTELKTGKDYNVAHEEFATGCILKLVTTAWEKLRPHLVETKLAPDALFKERIVYPENACQEALINAITHRDYSIEGQNIEIFIFDDRMEVHSPGGLLSTVKIDELKQLQGAHESRNALVARALREIGYVREMGEGMRRIFSLMRDADLVPPELASTPGRFTITLKHKSVFTDADQRWLDGFAAFKLTRQEMLVMLLGRDGSLISPQQIYDRLDLVDWDVYRTTIEGMQTKGLVQNAVAKSQKVNLARRRGVSQREIPRIIVRQPDECEKALKELYEVIGANVTSQIGTEYIKEVRAQLPPDNIYALGEGTIRFLQTIRTLGLTADRGTPTSSLISLWKSRSSTKQQTHPAPAPQPTTRTQPARPIPTQNRPTHQPQPPVAIPKTTAAELFVGNLNYEVTEYELRNHFEQAGQVLSAKIPPDFVTGKGRGFGFVVMASPEQAESAITQLRGKPLHGWPLRIVIQRPRQ